MTVSSSPAALLPGLAACTLVGAAALGLERVEAALFGRVWLEALVLAILLGAVVRTVRPLPAAADAGLRFAAKPMLELAIVLLGASFGFAAVAEAGPVLLAGIAVVVAVALAASYAVGRMLGLPHRLAVLVACGNAICGNSAIVAVAPTIGAGGEEVARAIAFTAVLGVAMVLGLPPLAGPLGLSETQYGVLAGLTVYAVPQILAATAPIGTLSSQVGTLVKLVRVLMLGPVILALSLWTRSRRGTALRAGELVPWFIVGFLALGALRTFGLVPDAAVPVLALLAHGLTLLSMAALGLGVDLRAVGHAGGRVMLAALLSLLVLTAASLALIRLAGIA